MASLPRRSDIRRGDRVSVETKADQGTGRLTDGTVDEVLTSSGSHPHGIKVRLQDGIVGRVKKVSLSHASKYLDMGKKTAPDYGTVTEKTAVRKDFVDLGKKEIPRTEDAQNEFKEFYQYDPQLENMPNKQALEGIKRSVRERFATAVCSFGNSREGGFVYLGINSDGVTVGLERDLKLGGFSDYEDSFANGIRNTLGDLIRDKTFIVDKLRIKFRAVDNKTICLIQVLPSSRPVYLYAQKECSFFVRGPAPRTEKLTGDDMVRYINDRFSDYR